MKRRRTASDGRKQLGAEGERIAAEYMIREGYRIISQNWRCRSGELDIVAVKNDQLVFVEVRSRRLTGRFGTPQESVDVRKQNQVRQTAQFFLYRHPQYDLPVRFDVIALHFSPDGIFSHLDHIINAF